MVDSARQQGEITATEAASPVRRAAVLGVRRAFVILLTVSGLAWLGWLLVSREPVAGAWTVQVILALATLVAGCWGEVHRYRTWTRPMRQLQELLPTVRGGELGPEALDPITGGPSALVPAIQDLFADLKTQRAMIVELESEMRTKVANRTDALERTIGSLRQQATRDALTGLFNRRFLDQYLAHAVTRHLRQRKDLCVLMIDVDYFKLLNDTHGHAAGDDLLKAIGQLIRSAIRGEDVGFRCGGDEFVILLPDSGPEAGQILGDRLASLVDALGKTIKGLTKAPRLAYGLANLRNASEQTPAAVLAMADRALYEVKRARKSHRDDTEGLNADAAGVQSPPLSRKAG
jgi:diguanylate cyclase (GGDEF)-like protein